MTTESVVETRLLAGTPVRERMSTVVVAFLVAVVVMLGCWPLIGRSIWVDEAMLLRNYPVEDVWAIFSPLGFYDQAAPPLYSLLASALSDDIEVARSLSVLVIAWALAGLLLYRYSGWLAAGLAFLSIAAFGNPLVMYSEFKHYGLEAVGVLLAIVWFVHREPDEPLSTRDVGVLTFSMLCGISTLIGASVALFLFLGVRYGYGQGIRKKEVAAALVFLAFAIAYYLLLKRITEFQIGTYGIAYESQGVIGNARRFLEAGYALTERTGVVVTVAVLGLLVFATQDLRARRLLLIAVATGVAFVAAAAVGVYPASQSRHLTWSGGLLSAVAFFGVYLSLMEGGYARTAARVVCLGLVLATGWNAVNFGNGKFEKAENNKAVEFLRKLPPSDIGLWVGAQPVIEYYIRLYPDLAKHAYFGNLNPSSTSAAISQKLPRDSDERFAQTRKEPGAWGRMVNFRMANDYQMPARAVVADAPRGREFHIFATHYDITSREGFWKARVDALHGALANAGCRSEVTAQFKKVSIYKVACAD